MDVDAVAGRLYRLPPEEFVAERDARVAEARAAGEKDAARELAALRRPTRAAWLTNLLVEAAPDEVEGLLALAPVLAEAQHSLDGAALRQVSARRGKLVGALTRRAAGLGREAGHRVDAGLERDVRAVLEAALADDELADRVRSGRLVKAERYSGFGTFGSGGTAAPAPSGRRAPRRPPTGRAPVIGSSSGDEGPPASSPDRGEPDAARRREREEREREQRERRRTEARERLERARLAAHDAVRERDDARERADSAAEDRDRAHHRVEELRAELDRARTAATDADRAARSAERDADGAVSRARRAEAELRRAEQALQDIDGGEIDTGEIDTD